MKKMMIEKMGKAMGNKAYGEDDISRIRPLMKAAAELSGVYVEMQDFLTNVSCTVKMEEKELFSFTYVGDVFDFLEYEIYPLYTMWGWIE